MGYSLKQGLALSIWTSTLLVLPSSILAQTPSAQQVQSLLGSLQDPQPASPDDVASQFRSSVDGVVTQSTTNQPSEEATGPLSEQDRQQAIAQARAQQERAAQQQQAAEQRLDQLLVKLNQQQAAQQAANQSAMAARPSSGAGAFVGQLTDEERQRFQALRSQTARQEQERIEGAPTTPEHPQPQPDTGQWLNDLPYYRDGLLTGESPDWESWNANFSGRMVGTAGDGSALDGRLHFGVDHNGTISGAMDFNTAPIDIQGHINSQGGLEAFVGSGGAFFGGIVSGQQRLLSGDLYGPAGESAAGDWSFVVMGGDRPGTASGQFGASKMEQEQ